MDTQDIALMLVVGILVIALIVVNTAPVGQQIAESTTSMDNKPLPMRIPVRSSLTTMVSIYNPKADVTTKVTIV